MLWVALWVAIRAISRAKARNQGSLMVGSGGALIERLDLCAEPFPLVESVMARHVNYGMIVYVPTHSSSGSMTFYCASTSSGSFSSVTV